MSFSQWPANRSMVVMLDLSSSWGFCSLREFSQEELDSLGGCSLTTILSMLETGKDVGLRSNYSEYLRARDPNTTWCGTCPLSNTML